MPTLDAASATSVELRQQAESARRNGQIGEAVALAERALARAQGDAVETALAQLELGNLLRYVPDTLRALQLLVACERALRERGHASLPHALTIKGMALGDAGDHTGALALYRDALQLLEAPSRERNPVQEATCFGAIGIACTQLENFAEAEDAYRRSLALYDEASTRASHAFIYNNLAILRVRAIQALADRASAQACRLGEEMLDFVRQGLAVNRATDDDPLASALLLNTQGDGLRALGRLEEALPTLNAALDIYRTMANPRGEIDAATDVAAAMLELDRVDDALALLSATRQRVAGLDLKDHERRVEELLAQAFERRGDAAAALAHYKAFHRLRDELRDLEAQRNLQRIAVRAEIDKAMRESREDALTGIANRRRFEEQMRDQTGAPPRDFAVAMLDIDHFKQINDRFSHATGDAVLRQVGNMLRAHCRGSDFVARVGGEEFVQFLRGVSADDAKVASERLRTTIESYRWTTIDPALAVTISIGVAVSDGAASLADLVKMADARLYAAKRGGRNRVVADGP
jgi:diguanylate cyclase (GGDEF)-like protein